MALLPLCLPSCPSWRLIGPLFLHKDVIVSSSVAAQGKKSALSVCPPLGCCSHATSWGQTVRHGYVMLSNWLIQKVNSCVVYERERGSWWETMNGPYHSIKGSCVWDPCLSTRGRNYMKLLDEKVCVILKIITCCTYCYEVLQSSNGRISSVTFYLFQAWMDFGCLLFLIVNLTFGWSILDHCG